MKQIRTLVAVGMVAAALASRVAIAQQQPRSTLDGVYTAAQARRGDALYQANCRYCHGPQLSGTEFAPGLTGAEFSARWKDRTVGELFDLMRATMPMNSPGGLSGQQNADILAFMLMTARVPEGKSDLPAAAETLYTIRIQP